ncbi:MFS transporter [Kiloniella laminariae]|uniref:MFS transporter n=1 Tax=Kiloniella laminariae TaxID=454162 RepID=A0ABT4LG97_9PROT|nr:MFS transporter [Kiloniella laminariae]MCZ4280133.1 MFS transporter [Kiloniella laminariae]
MTERDPTKANVFFLAICQALGMSCGSMLISMSALVGTTLAEDKSNGTLPLSLQFIGMMVCALPISYLMKHYGRRAGFSLGAVCGALSGFFSAQAILDGNFLLFCLSSFLFGAFMSTVAYFRFAAADTATEEFKSKAISLVMAGGVIAAFAGPELAKWSKEMDFFGPVLFVGSFYAISVLCLCTLVIIQFIDIPRLQIHEIQSSGRPVIEIARQPVFFVAVLSGIVSYACMNLIMSITPAAMIACAHPFEAAATVIQWHVFAMYAPSFFTGTLIRKYGAVRIQLLGVCFLLIAASINLSGVALEQFWFGLVALGLGWNFLYVGGSTMLTDSYRPEERAKIQAFNELLVFGVVATTAFGSGQIYQKLGWDAVNLLAFIPIILFLLVQLSFRRQLNKRAIA